MAYKFDLINNNMNEISGKILYSTLERRLSERGCSLLYPKDILISVHVDKTLENEAYKVMLNNGTCTIIAQDDCSAFAGVGAFLSASSFDGQGNFIPYPNTICHKPLKPIRGIYFATHFFNFYHSAEVEEIYGVIEDIALRGGNAIAVWYDMHHYTGIDDINSVQMTERLKKIMLHARNIGMKTCMTMISNEAFAGTADNLKATWHVQGDYIAVLDGHYHVEICPSQAGGVDEIIRQRRIVLKEFAEVKPNYIIIWPYDQGGCTCPNCSPWGANGFLKILPYFKKEINEHMPEAKIVVSTWYFDLFIKGEWNAFCDIISDGSLNWAEYLMSFFPLGEIPEWIQKNGTPCGILMISFPEISMFGANPIPEFLDETNHKSGMLYQGGFSYSEGIFEDINKWIMIASSTGKYINSVDAVREYVKFEFCTDMIDEITEIIFMLEKTIKRSRMQIKDGTGNYSFVIETPQLVDEIYERIITVDKKLSENIRKNWRWRIIYLRAVIDYELYNNNYIATERCDDCYNELIDIYHAEQAILCVCPPSRKALDRLTKK